MDAREQMRLKAAVKQAARCMRFEHRRVLFKSAPSSSASPASTRRVASAGGSALPSSSYDIRYEKAPHPSFAPEPRALPQAES